MLLHSYNWTSLQNRLSFDRIVSFLLPLTIPLLIMALPGAASSSLSSSNNRVALVIGNNAYPEASLSNAVNDAKLVAQTLSSLGFDVYDGYDLDRTDTSILLDRYLAALSDDGVGLFYFAGIGNEVGGRNYLLPTDVRYTPEGVRADGLPLDQLQLRLDALTRIKLLFIDACRDAPFGADADSRLSAPRIARPGPETFIGFATESGQPALDGIDGHSPFAQALVRHLAQPGLEIGPMFARVRRDVAEATKDRQQPASFSSLTDPFYFVPNPSAAVADAGIGSRPQSVIPPVPMLEAPDEAVYDPAQRGVPITGKVVSDDLAMLTVDGNEVVVGANGEFSYLLVGLSRGEKRSVAIRAVSREGYGVDHPLLVTRPVERRPTMAPALDPRKLHGHSQPDAVALVIGIERYGDPSLPPARFAAADAERFVDYAGWVLGVPEHRITLLTDGQATSGAVLSSVRETLLRARREGPIGPVYVFFSGHGLNIGGMPRLLAHDYDQYAVERTTIATSELIAWLEEREPKSITLFLDSCFSGQTRDRGTVVADARAIRAGTGSATSHQDRAAVLSASSGEGLSLSLPEVGQGAFSYVVMRGLGGEADADQDRAITLGELEAWTAQELPNLALTPSGPQRPSYNGVDPGRVLVRLD